MQISKLALRNFRNFKNCELEFSTNPEKNFTIILGQNTFGKTTLVKSFIWCLYRENLFEDKILLNSDIADKMAPNTTETAKVEIELEHKGFLYKVTTKQSYAKNNNGGISITSKPSTAIIKIDGENAIPVPAPRVAEEIESILRPELKEYFFFDGETNSIESISSKKNLTTAVTNILGLNKVEMLRDYFDPTKNESVTTYLRRELIAVDEDLLDSLNESFETELSKKEACLSEISDIEEEIEKLQEQQKKFEAILDANRDVESDQNEKKRLEKENEELINEKEKSFETMISIINTSNAFLKVLFANSYEASNLGELRNSSSFQSKNSYRGITETAVNDLIANGKCICGTVIKTGDEAYKHLLAAKEHMEPRDYGKYISDFDSSEQANVYCAKSTLENLLNVAGRVKDSIDSIDGNTDRLKTIRERIQGRSDVGEIQEDLTNIAIQLGMQIATLKQLNQKDLPQIEEQIDRLSESIEKASVKNDANEFTQMCIDYANSIYQLADKKIKNSKKEIQERLQQEVGSIFSSMYHGNREIKIDDNFKATTIVSKSGLDKKLDKSTGLGTVVNYSFVAGLMNLAKQSIIKDDEITDSDIGDNTYPLVMDAPFSNTDDEHIKNICNALPNLCDQIIMFVMKKDFNYASASILNKVGKMYTLVKKSETEASVQEEEIC